MSRRRNRKAGTGSTRGFMVVLIGLVLVIAIGYLRSRTNQMGEHLPDAPGLPVIPVKAIPKATAFGECPPEGDGGDSQLNLLKNRVDEGNYVLAEITAVRDLPWPRSVERVSRRRWSSDDLASVARYEGIPLSIDGYLAGAREEGPESTNCHGADSNMRDCHLWLVGSPDQDRSTSVVIELTPRILARHPEWNIEVIKDLVRTKEKVRVSGWLMLDPEHPDQIGKTRGTIWEIHPIMKIEVYRNGAWVMLDRGAGQ